MNNALALEKPKFNNSNEKCINYSSILKSIANDSLFYFGIFLFSLIFLQFFPFFTGLFTEINIGINEVVVSVIGFANVFFLQVFTKIFRKAN